MKPSILIVDDEPSVLSALALLFEKDYVVFLASNGQEVQNHLALHQIAVVLLDLVMPGTSGIELLGAIKVGWPDTEVIVVTAVRELKQVIACIKAGAYDYINKPWEIADLEASVKRAVEKWYLSREAAFFRTQSEAENKVGIETLGNHQSIVDLKEKVQKIASLDSNVLIQGETGTGKSLVARLIHSHSSRAKGRFVTLSCSGLSGDQLEVELFGHEEGIFSPLSAPRMGKLELASQGTLFLESVESLPARIGVRILEVLEGGEVRRLGGKRSIPVDLRIVSSTSQDLQQLIKIGAFREDLYWKLSSLNLIVPPLRERPDDIPLLFKRFIETICQAQKRSLPNVSDEIFEILKNYHFPGNVRELHILAETAVNLCEESSIEFSALPVRLLADAASSQEINTPGKSTIKKVIHAFERQFILKTLRSVKGSQTLAAHALGISKTGLINKMHKLKIPFKAEWRKGNQQG